MSTQASNTTANYGLSQWSESDRILMADFNADNAAIDAALKANADSITETAAGAFTLESGSYTGTGTYGSANPTTITTEKTPVVVWVWCKQTDTIPALRGMATIPAGTWVCVYHNLLNQNNLTSTQTAALLCSSTEHSVSFYGSGANSQFNESGRPYGWAALCR